jgi:hypothetical protein
VILKQAHDSSFETVTFLARRAAAAFFALLRALIGNICLKVNAG